MANFPARCCFLELAAYYATNPRRSDEAIAMLRDVIDEGAGSLAQNVYHAMLFEQSRPDNTGESFNASLLPAMLDASHTAEARREIVSLCLNYNAKRETLRIDRMYVQLSLYACGEHERAVREWAAMLGGGQGLLWNEEYPLRLFSGQWDPDTTLKAAGDSGQRRAVAHYVIAQ